MRVVIEIIGIQKSDEFTPGQFKTGVHGVIDAAVRRGAIGERALPGVLLKNVHGPVSGSSVDDQMFHRRPGLAAHGFHALPKHVRSLGLYEVANNCHDGDTGGIHIVSLTKRTSRRGDEKGFFLPEIGRNDDSRARSRTRWARLNVSHSEFFRNRASESTGGRLTLFPS